MRRLHFFQFIICLVLSSRLLSGSVKGQVSQHNARQDSISGWTDNTHYCIRKLDPDGSTVFRSVDIKTGNSVIIPAPISEKELLIRSLPANSKFGVNDAITPDKKSAVLIYDNDLYYFANGAKELRRLTNDKTPEINSTFSPDGKKLAYTKNKDLYVYDLTGYKETRLTFDASDKIYNGYCSWVYMEEILERTSHYAAFWWSPDGN